MLILIRHFVNGVALVLIWTLLQTHAALTHVPSDAVCGIRVMGAATQVLRVTALSHLHTIVRIGRAKFVDL